MRGSSGRVRVLACVLALGAVAAVLSGCGSAPASSGRAVAPKLRPPGIAKAGVLRVAVDASYPPFAAKDATGFTGLDVDVASALAARLGLRAEFVDVPVGSLSAALREKRADIALGGLPMTDAALSDVAVATSYLSDAPVLFSREGSTVPEGVAGLRIGVQKESAAYWLLRAKVGEDALVAAASLREAFDRLAAGDVDAVAGDALVGGYILREYQTLRMTTQLADAIPLAVLVPKDADAVESVVRDEMDVLAGGGVLDAIRAKWVAQLPPLRLAAAVEEPAGEADGASLVTVTPAGPVLPADPNTGTRPPTSSPVMDTSVSPAP